MMFLTQRCLYLHVTICAPCGIFQSLIQTNRRRCFLRMHWPKVPDNQFTELYPCQLAPAKNVMIQQFNGSWVWQQSPSKPLLGNKMIQAQVSGRFSNCLLLAQTQKQSRPWRTTEPALEYVDSWSRFYQSLLGRINLLCTRRHDKVIREKQSWKEI